MESHRHSPASLQVGAILVLLAAQAGAQVRVELAGLALPDFPFFQRVLTFNEDQAVLAAVDPALYPQVAGQTADLYLVAHKSPAQWQSDPSLVDLRPGGAQVVVFSAGPVQANTVTLAGPGELDSQPAMGLGVAYDVVVDLDRDGFLGGSDLADGLGDAAGFYVVQDTSAPGPLAVAELDYAGGAWLTQRIYYPAAIAGLGELPLVVISHGWTHSYLWYGHIGRHLASYGYVVMSHRNNVGDGGPQATRTAAQTTLSNTDHLIGNQAAIGGGVLAGHLDAHRIAWIGHSTGGEGVVLAHTLLREGGYVPAHFSAEDVALVSSIAPVAWLGPEECSPGGVNYHIFIGAADTDASGAPRPGYYQSMAIYERARGARQLIYVQGAGHADFHDGGGDSWAQGPDLIGREATHTVVRGYYLPLMELYLRDNPAALDFFTRLYEGFRPIGVPEHVIVANEYKAGPKTPRFVIDDFQTHAETGIGSAGGAVSFTVSNLAEVRMMDTDFSFDWTDAQPSNGMTRALFPSDQPRCAVFDWSSAAPGYYELEIPPGRRDLSRFQFLSFRACQGTRHPETDLLDSPLSFTLVLRDGQGSEAAIDFGRYGRITRTYERTGYGTGAGWGNEFSTVRLSLTDFLTNGTGLDLADVVALCFRFGPGQGSERGRIGLDDIEVVGGGEILTAAQAQGGRHPPLAAIAWPNPSLAGMELRLQPALGQDRGLFGGAIYDAGGRLVRRLDARVLSPGKPWLVWDGRDEGGLPVPAGLYLYRLSCGRSIHGGRLLRLD